MAELQTAKAPNESDEQQQKEVPPEAQRIPLGDSDTETEPSTGLMKPPSAREPATTLKSRPSDAGEAIRKRRSLGDSSGYVSTDSEWEKVSENSEKER